MIADQRAERMSFDGFVRAVRRRWWVVVLAIVVVPASAFIWSASQEAQYEAKASLFFRSSGLVSQVFGATPDVDSAPDPTVEKATNVSLTSLETIAKRTARALGNTASGAEIASNVEVSAEDEDSNVVSIIATFPDPVLAADVANTYGEQYIDFRRSSDQRQIERVRSLIRAQLEQASRQKSDLPPDQAARRERALQRYSDELRDLSGLQTGNAEVVEGATPPTAAISPKPLRNAALGLALGPLLGIALVVLFELLSRRVNDPRDIEELFDRPVVGTIPKSRSVASVTHDSPGLPPAEREAFQMLRTNLRYLDVNHIPSSIVVTSAASGDGKTTVAWNLASAAAQAGARVVLLEAELRRPSYVTKFGVPATVGLSQVLTGDASVEEAIHCVDVAQRVGSDSPISTMDVIVAGPLPPNPTELIESARMSGLIRDLQARYDLLVVDTPPTSIVSDATPLMKEIGGVIVVARVRKTTREGTQHLRARLESLGVPILGVVLNGISVNDGYETYGYYHGPDRAGKV